MKKRIYTALVCLILVFAQTAFALKERHLIIIRHGESQHNITQVYNSNPQHPNYQPSHLTEQGRKQIKQTAELLLTYGFDNRSIGAVLVSPLPRTIETADILTVAGVFDKSKIKIEPRLIENQAGDRENLSVSPQEGSISQEEAHTFHGEPNEAVRQRMLAVYDELQKQHPEGHIIFITDGTPAMELIQSISKTKVKLQIGQMYLMPIVDRKEHLAKQ